MPRPIDPLEGLTRDSVRALVLPQTRTIEVPVNDLQWRVSDSGDGSRILSGYAAVFGQRTTIYKSKYWQLDELIAPAAFDAVLSDAALDCHLNIGHDMNRAIARTGIKGVGGLELSVDPHGLRVYARLNPADPDVVALAAKMDMGILDQMSFAFRMGATTSTTETDGDGYETELLTVETVANLYDVCVCAQGAYPATEAALRTALAAMSYGTGAQVTEVTRTPEGAQDDPAVTGTADGDRSRDVERARLSAKAAEASLKYQQTGATQ